MIGNLRLLIRNFIKQQITCKHEYKTQLLRGLKDNYYEECTKCDKIK